MRLRGKGTSITRAKLAREAEEQGRREGRQMIGGVQVERRQGHGRGDEGRVIWKKRGGREGQTEREKEAEAG